MRASQGRGASARLGACGLHRPALYRWLLPVLAVLTLMANCAGPGRPATPDQPGPASLPPASTPGEATPAPGFAQTPASSLTLTIWGPDSMAPLDDVPGGAVLAAQIDAFSRAHPGTQVRYVRKKPYGPGGVVHFLRSSAAVAADTLPDLALIDMREVALVADSGILQPLDTLLDPSLTADLAPFARQAGQVGEHLLAVQYGADLRFLAYNSAAIDEPPATWSELMESGLACLLPIGNSEGAVADAFLPNYLALGAKLTDRDGQPYLDEAVVAAILESYRAALQAGVLSTAGLELGGASDCWPVYLTNAGGAATDNVAMTNVTSWDYGRERARLASTRVAPLPTLSGALTSMASGWGWVLLTKDATRQSTALAFLRTVLQPEAMAAWSEATYHLPTRLSALPMAIDDKEYLRFLQRLMDAANPQPREPAYSASVAALAPAIAGVAQGTLDPKEAAMEAALRVRTTQE